MSAVSFVNIAPATGVAAPVSVSQLRGHVANSAPVTSSAPSSMFCLSTAAVGMVAAAGVARQQRRAKQARASRVCRAAALDASKELGALAPVGYWDPCGLMKERVGVDGWQWKDEKTFEKYRVAELKHGRVAMLAATGLLTNIFWKFEGYDLVPQGLSALDTAKGGAGFGLIFIVAAYFELTNWKGEFPDPLDLGKSMDENMDSLRNKELNNGRIGMAATITLLMYDAFENKLPSEMLYHTKLTSTTLPAVITLALLVLPLSSQIFNYDTTPAEIKAKNQIKAAAAKELKAPEPEPVPVTLKAEIPKEEEKTSVKEEVAVTADKK